MPSDKRSDPRKRTRLRSGKIADPSGNFLAECVIHDRSAEGARLRIDHGVTVPDDVLLFEDEHESLVAASVVWRRPQELGVSFRAGPATGERERIARRLSGKYYAL
jgi:hypothetical protein